MPLGPVLPADLLSRSPETAVRLILGQQLYLLHGAMAEAFDTLCAALRRLRTTLGTYRHLLPRRRVRDARARLRTLLRLASIAHRSQQALELLAAIAPSPTPEGAHLHRRLRKRARRDERRARRALDHAVPRLLRRLRPIVERHHMLVTVETPQTFDVAARAAVQAAADRMSELLFDEAALDASGAIGSLRRRAGALRDVLEPVAAVCPPLRPPVATLAELHVRLELERAERRLQRRLRKEARRAPKRLERSIIALAEKARPDSGGVLGRGQAGAPRDERFEVLGQVIANMRQLAVT